MFDLRQPRVMLRGFQAVIVDEPLYGRLVEDFNGLLISLDFTCRRGCYLSCSPKDNYRVELEVVCTRQLWGMSLVHCACSTATPHYLCNRSSPWSLCGLKIEIYTLSYLISRGPRYHHRPRSQSNEESRSQQEHIRQSQYSDAIGYATEHIYHSNTIP